MNEMFYLQPPRVEGPAIQKHKEERERLILTWQLFLYDFLIKLIRMFYLQCLKEKRKETN